MGAFKQDSDGGVPAAARARLILCVVAFLVACAGAGGCGGPASEPPAAAPVESFGTRLAFGHHELYFTDGVEADAARKAGEVLIREKCFGDRPASVQMRYVSRRYELRFVVRAGAETDSPAKWWRAIGEAVSKECFRGSPVDVHLCDERLNTLRVIPYEPIRPELPVRVTTRKSAGGGSLVAQYRNDSEKYLTVRVSLRNPTLDQSKSVVLNIAPRGVTEHGWAEGWAYKSGETVTITHADHETLELVVP